MADKGSVDKLKDKLYSRADAPDTDPASRTPLSPEREGTPHSWDDIRPARAPEPAGTEPGISEEVMPFAMKKKKRSAAAYFLLGSFAFFCVATAVATYTFIYGGNTISPNNIDMQILAPSLIDSGKQTTFQFVIDNRNQTVLKAADIVINYPSGTRDPQNPTQPLLHQRISLGDIASGQQINQTAGAIIYGQEGAQDTINATLEYQIAGSNAIFTKESSAPFTIGSAPVSLAISSPDQAISGQPFTMTVTVTSNATSPLPNVAVQAQYPFGFTFASSNPQAQVGGTFWQLGSLNPGASQTITLTGALSGQDGDLRVFHFLVGSESDPTDTSVAVPLLSIPQTVTVRQPFLSGAISLDGQTGNVIAEPLGKNVQGSINWQNTSSSTVSNVTFTLSLSGAALDPSSVQAPNAFYDSSKSQIIWNSQEDPTLASVPPGTSGTLQFSFATYPPGQTPLTNPQLSLNLTADATRQDNTGAPQNITSAASATVNLASAVSLSAQALHFSGPFTDGGPMPPVVGQTTAYTVVWTVRNSSNSIAQSQVSATLPPYVSFDQADASNGEQVTYDESTRTVTWNIGNLAAGAGYADPARQVAFQVSMVPSLTQVEQSPQLTSDATFSGIDRFAQAQVQASAPGPTIVLTGDSGFQSSMGAVSN